MDNLPGPQVGNADREQTILPPVAESAMSAESRTGNKAGSGFLTSANSAGNRSRRDTMTDLELVSCAMERSFPAEPTLIRKGQRKARRFPKAQKGPRDPASPTFVLGQV